MNAEADANDGARRELVRAPHARSAEEVLAELGSSVDGLSSAEARRRLERHGRNAMPRARPPGLLSIVLRQFASPLIYVLLIATAVSAAIGDFTDALFILGVLALNATIGAVQEHHAQRSADALRALVVARAHVLRDGEERDVDAEEITPGDVVIVESGAKVPADLRMVSGGVEVDESLLTGESIPVLKRASPGVAEDAPLADRLTMLHAGTIVTRGRAHGVVVGVGLSTVLGQIASSIVGTDAAPPPLLLRMERFTRKIAATVAIAVVLLGSVLWLRGASLHDIFLGSVALAVSVVPEGLPVAMTVALAIAVRRMSRRKVIARRLAAVEALGSCTFIASDKTGTLTLNQLSVQELLLPGGVRVDAGAEAARADVPLRPTDGERERELDARIERFARAVVLCNDSSLAHKDGSWVSHGDAVDVALLVLAQKAGVSRAHAETEQPRLAALPFEAERQYAASVNSAAGGPRIFVKGAGERVLSMCSRMAGAEGDVPLERGAVEARADALAADGFRMLAVAEGRGRVDEDGNVDPRCLADLTLLGFAAMIDPSRPEVPAAIESCKRAGVQVAMVTGDHPVTAQAIARELGLAKRGDPVVTGPALREARASGEKHFDELVFGTRVFARVEPQQKLEIVQALMRQGHFVALTGDGANDAPAMRAANIGVAMGLRGTDVARETGELIVTDDNFASIVAGIEEGRIAYGNVRKVIYLLISSGAAELVLFILSIGAGLPLPLLPAQLLWLNLVTNGIQDVALAFEPGEGGELERPARSPGEPIIDRLMLERTVLAAVVMGGVCFLSFRWMLSRGYEISEARNVLLLLMVLFENVQAGNSRSERRSLFALSPFRNPLLFAGTAAAQLIHVGAMSVPGLSDVLRAQPVSLTTWLTLLGIALSLFVVMELDKAVRNWRGRRAAQQLPVLQ